LEGVFILGKKQTVKELRPQDRDDKDWKVTITRVANGFIVEENSYGEKCKRVIQEKSEWSKYDEDVIYALIARELCWDIIDTFALFGSKYSQRRVRVVLEKGDHYLGDDDFDEQDAH